jgi:hypothetical protein
MRVMTLAAQTWPALGGLVTGCIPRAPHTKTLGLSQNLTNTEFEILDLNFYLHRQAPRASRPRVFGMTASPVNIRAHHAADRIRTTIYELEDNLDAKVLTPSL